MMTITRKQANMITGNEIINLGTMKNLKGKKVETKAIAITITNKQITFLCNDGDFCIDAIII
jgi:hypothetical protein